jgi:hypothetical protein
MFIEFSIEKKSFQLKMHARVYSSKILLKVPAMETLHPQSAKEALSGGGGVEKLSHFNIFSVKSLTVEEKSF